MIISAALSRQVFTLEDVQQLQLELQSVLDALAEGRSVPQTLRKLPAHFSLTPTEQADHAAAGKAVERIIRTLQSLPVIRLSVPYYPTRSQVEELAVLVKNATTPTP